MSTKNSVNCRYITLQDDLEEIGKLIYLADPFIYPALFGNVNYASLILSEAIQKSIYCFRTNTIFAAFDGDRPIGIICENPGGKYIWNESDMIDCFDSAGILLLDNSLKVMREYFETMNEENFQNQSYLLTVCVSHAYQGKGIATKMMSEYLRIKDQSVVLDTLQNNVPAVHLYQKLGFRIVTEYKGFSLEKPLPDCYRMERKLGYKNERT